MQDLEITIERGRLWMLQTRRGRQTGKAATRIAAYMVNEGPTARRAPAQSALARGARR
jgi:pyruvate,orthophosphate dikinase